MIFTHTYTNYCHETVIFCYSKTFIKQKIFSKTTGNFLNSKLVIYGMPFAKSIAFHHIYTISLYTTYQLQSSRKNKTWIFERVYLAGLFIFTNLWKFILAKLKKICVLVKRYFPQSKQSFFFFVFFFELLESLRFYDVYEWKKNKIKMYLEKHLTKPVWSNDLREKARLLLTVLKNIFLIISLFDLWFTFVKSLFAHIPTSASTSK